MSSSTGMIRTSGLAYSYGSGRRIKFADLHVPQREHYLLLGDSGSGKTTLLHLLGGLLRSQQGSIRISDTDITTLSEPAMDHFRGQHMGYIFQQNHLLNSLTVRDNLLVAPFLAGLQQEKERVTHILTELGLDGYMNSSVTSLSLGQAQRVAIGRALMNRPKVIFADEPTSALDDVNCKKVMDLMIGLGNEHGITLVIATHDHRIKMMFKNQIQL